MLNDKSLTYTEFKTLDEAKRYLSTIQNKLSEIDNEESEEETDLDEDFDESLNPNQYTKDKFKRNYFSKDKQKEKTREIYQ